MNTNRRRAVAALTAAGLLWGTTVPLSKLALEWLPPGWLTFARFGLAALVLLAVAPRRGIRAACTPRVLASGALGYGGSVAVQNVGITRTSVIHAALLIGTVPVMVAVIAALWQRTVARPVAWAGFAVSLVGVGLVTGGRGGGATAAGDGLVLASLLLSATFTVAQGGLLRGRDPVAVTAVQFLGAALAVLPFSVLTEGAPPAPPAPGAVLAVIALAAGGTVLPFTLFAYGQSRVSAEVAGSFYNIEPLVGAVIGVVAFGDPAGLAQAVGGAAIVAGIALSSLPLLRGGTPRPVTRFEGGRQRAARGDLARSGPGGPPRRDPTAGGPGLAGGLARDAWRAAAGARACPGPARRRRGVAARLPGPPGRPRLPRAQAAALLRRRVVGDRARHALGGRLVPARPGRGLGRRAARGGDRGPAGPVSRRRPPGGRGRPVPGRAPAG
jgi:O-acetylserine/cysteine efflux transporter